jgi:hypothetical protein
LLVCLVLTLTACGNTAQPDRNDANTDSSDSLQEDDTGTDRGDSIMGDMGDAVTDGAEDAGQAVTNGVDDAEDTLERTTRSATGGTSYEQMLRNARVHDQDGDLLDGENAMTPGGLL